MRLKNSTKWSDTFLRRMVSWVCRELDMPVRKIREAQFRNRTRENYSGHAWGGTRFVVSIGPERAFPVKPHVYSGVEGCYCSDRTEGLVVVTAHEIRHLLAAWTNERTRGNGRRYASSERATEFDAQKVLAKFREHREVLLADWSRESSTAKSIKPTVKESRAAKAEKDLARWQRKLKLAQTKVKTYRRKVRYYERSLSVAAKQSQ